MTAIDLTPEYCEVARWLNDAVGLGDTIDVRTADATDLPFDAGSFDVVVSQHVQMNIADKRRLYAEARRVLAPGGRLALWDATAGPGDPCSCRCRGRPRPSRAISSPPNDSPNCSARPAS